MHGAATVYTDLLTQSQTVAIQVEMSRGLDYDQRAMAKGLPEEVEPLPGQKHQHDDSSHQHYYCY